MRAKTTGKNNQQGFTLVEVLTTILVAGILIGGFTTLLTNYSYMSQRGRDLTVANSYAENKIEESRSKGYVALNIGSTNISSELPSELSSPKSGTLNITSPQSGIKKLELTITYNEQGKSKTHTYTSLLGELGVGQY